jgi:hypothetical protein
MDGILEAIWRNAVSARLLQLGYRLFSFVNCFPFANPCNLTYGGTLKGIDSRFQDLHRVASARVPDSTTSAGSAGLPREAQMPLLLKKSASFDWLSRWLEPAEARVEIRVALASGLQAAYFF